MLFHCILFNLTLKNIFCHVFRIFFFRLFDRTLHFIGLSARKAYFNIIHVILRDRDNFNFVRFFSLYLFVFIYSFIFFNAVWIWSCVTQGVRWAPVKTSLHAIVSIFRAETSVLANEVTVLSWSVTVFFQIATYQDRLLTDKLGCYFHIQNNIYGGSK